MTSSKGALCVITARGGSKRIPRKNVKDFLGKPIISYSIEAAFESGLFDEVMVSTDDEGIAEVAKRYGAEVPFLRSSKTSDDYATTADVVVEVVEEYKRRGRSFDVVCCIYPTAPFVTAKKLSEGMGRLTPEIDSVLPVVAFSFPPQRGMLADSSGVVKYWQPECARMRSQDLSPVYHDAGQFYFSWVDRLVRTGELLGPRTAGVVVSEMEAQDIDNEVDWLLAEMKYRRMIANEQAQR